jgi:hypothetical protein
MRESVYRISQPVDAYLYVALKRANTSFKLAEELRTRSPQEREPFWSIIRCFCARHDFEPLFGRVSLHHLNFYLHPHPALVESCSLLLKNGGKDGCNEVVCAAQTRNFV